jgi:hypothetical protein
MKHLFAIVVALCVSFAHSQTIVTSNDLLSLGTTSGSARIYGIATALAQGTTGVTVSGFDYGYKYNLGSSYTQCTATNQDGSCSWWMTFSPRADVSIQIRNNENGLIYNQTHTHTGQNITGGQNNIQYRFADPRNITSLSTFRLGVGIQGAASVYEPYSKAVYSVDPCVIDPLSSTSCPGYQAAYHDQQCSINPLYAVTCPGYQTAYFNQQCTASALYNSACPGYAQALFTQTCNNNPLSDATCPGYANAYFNQQCSLNGLYDRTCPNYGRAFIAKNPPTVTIAVPTAPVSDTSTSDTTDPTSPTSVTSVLNPPKPPGVEMIAPAPSAKSAAKKEEQQKEQKKTDSQVARALAKTNAETAAREAATAVASATTLEAQAATQGLVVGLMGHVPGFGAYQNAIVPDVLGAQVARQYHKPTVDNRSVQRQLSGSNEVRWKQMVDSQYKQ